MKSLSLVLYYMLIQYYLFYQFLIFSLYKVTSISIIPYIISELMLFFACFRYYINPRSIGLILLLFYFPLLSRYPFPTPFTNPLILLFPSLSIQYSQVFIKIGFLNYPIEGLGQSPIIGFYLIILQCKEFLYSYFSLTDRLIGSIHHLITGLHGPHILSGLFLFYIIFIYIIISITIPSYLMEFSFPLPLSSYH